MHTEELLDNTDNSGNRKENTKHFKRNYPEIIAAVIVVVSYCMFAHFPAVKEFFSNFTTNQ